MRPLHATLCNLEPQVAAHAGAMFDVLSDPAIYEFENAPPSSAIWLAERFARLETRLSPDGSEQWLNWVVRLPSNDLAGFVQATVASPGMATVACVLASRHWRQGIGRCAMLAMFDELGSAYGVHTLLAVIKTRNVRSQGFFQHLGF
ncbi:MAG: hypothetical protein B7Z55_01825, partial [Planctomycetales bacterium 12-60-4]